MIEFSRCKVGNCALSEERTGSCLSYEKLFACGAVFAFRCCKIRILYPFCSDYRKGFLMKNIFKFPKFSVYKLCTLSMLVAITAILAVFCTFRIGDAIKIPMKFISVFVASALFGPWLGGLCGALGDLINVFLVPSGAPLPLLTALEFFVGFIYGVFFYNRTTNPKSHILRCVLCTIIIFLSDIFLSTAVLLTAGYFPDFTSAVIIRLPAGIIKAIIQLVFFIFSNRFITMLKRVGRLKNE